MSDNVSEIKFINLLLRNTSLLEDWKERPIPSIDAFSQDYFLLLQAIKYYAEQGFLLTAKTFASFTQRYVKSKNEEVAQEILYNNIYQLSVDENDFAALRDDIHHKYLKNKSLKLIEAFGTNVSNDIHQIPILLSKLSDQVGGLVDTQKAVNYSYDDAAELGLSCVSEMLDIRSGKKKQDELIHCGIKEIDHILTTGFYPGSLTLFCADVGSYKTTMMLNVSINIWKHSHKNVLFVPLEMPKEIIVKKILSRETGVPFSRLMNPETLTDDDIDKIQKEQKSWESLPARFYVMESMERTSVSMIRREIFRHIDIFNPNIIVIDYISNMKSDTSYRDRNDLEIGSILKDLRALALKSRFAVISGAQLGREALKRIRKNIASNATAHSEDIRGSHEFAADSDYIFAQFKDPNQPHEALILTVIKSRYGGNIFPNGDTRTTLEVVADIGLIQSREDWIANVDQSEILRRVDETAPKDILTGSVEKPKKKSHKNDIEW